VTKKDVLMMTITPSTDLFQGPAGAGREAEVAVKRARVMLEGASVYKGS